MPREREFHNYQEELSSKLRKYVGKNVILHLRSGETIEGELKRVDKGIVKTGELVMVSPYEEGQISFTLCSDIMSFSVIITP